MAVSRENSNFGCTAEVSTLALIIAYNASDAAQQLLLKVTTSNEMQWNRNFERTKALTSFGSGSRACVDSLLCTRWVWLGQDFHDFARFDAQKRDFWPEIMHNTAAGTRAKFLDVETAASPRTKPVQIFGKGVIVCENDWPQPSHQKVHNYQHASSNDAHNDPEQETAAIYG